MSPLIPAEWEAIEAPAIAVDAAGPAQPRDPRAGSSATAYPGLSAGLTPLALDVEARLDGRPTSTATSTSTAPPPPPRCRSAPGGRSCSAR